MITLRAWPRRANSGTVRPRHENLICKQDHTDPAAGAAARQKSLSILQKRIVSQATEVKLNVVERLHRNTGVMHSQRSAALRQNLCGSNLGFALKRRAVPTIG